MSATKRELERQTPHRPTDDFYLEPEDNRAPHGSGLALALAIMLPIWVVVGGVAAWVLG